MTNAEAHVVVNVEKIAVDALREFAKTLNETYKLNITDVHFDWLDSITVGITPRRMILEEVRITMKG